MSEFDVVLVGPYPPPRGGVSAHVARVAKGARERGLRVAVVNHFRGDDPDPLVIAGLHGNPWRYWRVLRAVDGRIVHYHHSRWSTLLAAALALRRRSAATVVTVHGRELEPYLSSRFPGVPPLTRWALRRFDVLVAVSAEVARSLACVGDRRIVLIPAYIPSGDETATLSREAAAFMGMGTPLLTAAYRLSIDRHGQTLYGLETAIGAFTALAERRRDLRLAIFVASPPRSRHEGNLLRRLVAAAGEEDVRDRIAVFFGEPLAPALRHAAIYLRPTLTDGDAVSIREALVAGVPVLASDVVARPPGVRTVELSASAWAGEIERTLTRSIDRPAPPPPAAADPLGQLIGIYDDLRPRSAPRSAALAR